MTDRPAPTEPLLSTKTCETALNIRQLVFDTRFFEILQFDGKGF